MEVNPQPNLCVQARSWISNVDVEAERRFKASVRAAQGSPAVRAALQALGRNVLVDTTITLPFTPAMTEEQAASRRGARTVLCDALADTGTTLVQPTAINFAGTWGLLLGFDIVGNSASPATFETFEGVLRDFTVTQLAQLESNIPWFRSVADCIDTLVAMIQGGSCTLVPRAAEGEDEALVACAQRCTTLMSGQDVPTEAYTDMCTWVAWPGAQQSDARLLNAAWLETMLCAFHVDEVPLYESKQEN